MKISKIILLIGLVVFVSLMAVNIGFAANDDLVIVKANQTITYDKKVSTIEGKYVFNNKKEDVYLNVKVKKDYQKKYGIKSVKIKYYLYNKNGNYQKTIYKYYNGKNKKSILIKIPKYSGTDKIVINYKTNSNLKKEVVNLFMRSTSKTSSYLESKRSKATMVQKGYNKINGKKIINGPTYQKIQIQTNSGKYKMKLIKFIGFNTTSKKEQYIDIVPENVNKYVKISYEFYNDLKFNGIKIYYY
ncbi:MAG: hypothetical protein ACRCVG_07135 [Methanobacteriaceae archaeon]